MKFENITLEHLRDAAPGSRITAAAQAYTKTAVNFWQSEKADHRQLFTDKALLLHLQKLPKSVHPINLNGLRH